MAATAPGMGGKGPSFEASRTTDSYAELVADVGDRPAGLVDVDPGQGGADEAVGQLRGRAHGPRS